MNTYINKIYLDKVSQLAEIYATNKAEGKQGCRFKKTFNSAKNNYLDIAFYLYMRVFKLSVNCSDYNFNHIDSSIFKGIGGREYKDILDDLIENKVISINSSYFADKKAGFSKSYLIDNELLGLFKKSLFIFNYNSELIDISRYKFYSLNGIRLYNVVHLAGIDKREEELMNKMNLRKHKVTHTQEELKNTLYSKITYDLNALKEYFQGDEYMYERTKNILDLKLKCDPEIYWNRYSHIFHRLGKDFRIKVLRLDGEKITEKFDIPGSDLHMLAKIVESKDIPEREIENFQLAVKEDFRKIFGICKATGKAKAQVKHAFKVYLNAKKDYYQNIKFNSTSWKIDQYFKEEFPHIRELLINWEEIDTGKKISKGLWAECLYNEFETISVRLTNMLKAKGIDCLTVHDAVYIKHSDDAKISEEEVQQLFYDSLDLYIDRKNTFFNL